MAVASRRAPLRCPGKYEILAALIAMLPRGRAWQTHEAGPAPSKIPAFQASAFNTNAFLTASQPGSILYRFWAATAEVLAFLNRRLCDLRMEFWCATHAETNDLWMAEYGLPDACDPFPDLCTKVAALGGQRCEYFSGVAIRSGWSIDCVDGSIACGTRAGCGLAGRARVGGARLSTMMLVVHLSESPAYVARTRHVQPMAGRYRAGAAVLCTPPADISALRCLIERIAPAHLAVSYVTQ